MTKALSPEQRQAIVFRVEQRLHGHIIYPDRPLVRKDICYFCDSSDCESYVNGNGLRICEHCLRKVEKVEDGDDVWFYAYGKAVRV